MVYVCTMHTFFYRVTHVQIAADSTYEEIHYVTERVAPVRNTIGEEPSRCC